MYNFNLINNNMENNNNNNNLNNSNNLNNINNNKTTTSNNNNFFQLKNNNNTNNILNNTTNNNNNNNHCNMEWSNEICLRLIDEYKNFPALWDQTSPFYKNKLKRKESWCRLAERFGCSKAEVERKMNVLLTQYRREKHKMLMQVYKGELKCSRWYAFKKFSFMENGLRPKKQQRALQLLNAMQLRLGYNPLQSVHNAPSIQNLATWHSTNEILNQSDNNNSLSITNDTEQSCPPSVQDLSINHINDTGQMHHNNPIQQQSANSTIEDEMVEINVDPLNLLGGHHLNTQSFKHANNNNNNIKQRSESLSYHHHDVKEEVFDSSSIDNDDHHHHNSFQRNIDRSNNIHHNNINNSNNNQNDVDDDDEEDDEQYSILDFRRNRYSSDTSPKKKINFHTTQTTTTTTDQSTTYPHHFHHSTSSLTEQQQQQKDDKNDRWSELLQQVPTTAASSSTEKPSTTKLFQNYDSQSMSLADKDDCDFVGLNVALKLRSMEESQRIIAEKLISDILFYGQFKELDRTANVCPKRDNSG